MMKTLNETEVQRLKPKHIGRMMFLTDKRLFILIAVIVMSAMVFADDVGTNSVSVVDQTVEVVKSYIPEIKGNAIWDVVKILLAWGWQLILAAILLLAIVCSLFSQRIHVAMFIKGRLRGLFWFSEVKPFGRLVDKNETREYRKFDSPARTRVVSQLNAHSGVFLVMGPPGVGKSLMVKAESKAKYVLEVDRDAWYDSREDAPAVKEILKERTTLLVKNLIFKKPICVLLTWNATSTIPMPSKYRMEKIVAQLSGILSESKNFRMVSFVLIVPAYYQLDSPQLETNDYCRMPEEHSVNLMNCSECMSLLDAQLKYKVNTEGLDMVRVRRDLSDEARDCGLTLERMVWIESFGKPKQVVGIVGSQQYKSPEVWKSLRDWWNQVYAADNKEEWLSYLYVIALASLVNKSPVDAASLAKKLFGDRSRLVDEALGRICVKPRPAIREEQAAEGWSTVRQKAKFSDERPFSLRKLMPELVFEDPYVIESLVGSLGCLLDESGQKIFNFREQVCDAIKDKKAFLLDDIVECGKLADVYMAVAERFSNLSQRLSEQYALLGHLEEAFGTCKLVEAYGRRLRDPVAFQDFVSAVISRIGALPVSMFSELLESINDTLLANNSSSGYATLVFEMLPVFIITERLPHAWKVDFKTLVDEMVSPDAADEVQFRCAAILCVAYATYKGEEIAGGKAFCSPDVKEHFGIVESEFPTVLELVDRDSGQWPLLKEIIRVIDTMAQDGSLPALDIEALPPDVRMIWLSVFCILMWVHGAKTDSDVSMDVVFSISRALDGVELTGSEGMLIGMYNAQMPYWLDCDINTEEGIALLRQDIDNCKREIEKWADCPGIAAKVFSSICDDYWLVCNSGVEELWSSNVVWELHRILLEWQRGMSDLSYSDCLSTFAFFLYRIADGRINVDLQNIWKDFAERVKEFWLPILAGERGLEDWTMPSSFLRLYSSLSNVKTILPSIRVTLLQAIVPNDLILCCENNSNRVSCAWNIYNCDSSLVQPHTKMLWCAKVMAGKQIALFSNDSAAMIRAAEDLINEARAIDERNVDEELVRKLYEANGLPVEPQGKKERTK